MTKKLLLALLSSIIIFSSMANDIATNISSYRNNREEINRYVINKYNSSYLDLKKSKLRSESKIKNFSIDQMNLSLISYIFRVYDNTNKNSAQAMDKTLNEIGKLTNHTADLNLITTIYTKYQKTLSSSNAMDLTFKQLRKIQNLQPLASMIYFIYEAYFSDNNDPKSSMDFAINQFKNLTFPANYSLDELQTAYQAAFTICNNTAKAMDFVVTYPNVSILPFMNEAYILTSHDSKLAKDQALKKFKLLPKDLTLKEIEMTYQEFLPHYKNTAETMDATVNDYSNVFCRACYYSFSDK